MKTQAALMITLERMLTVVVLTCILHKPIYKEQFIKNGIVGMTIIDYLRSFDYIRRFYHLILQPLHKIGIEGMITHDCISSFDYIKSFYHPIL